MTLVKAGINRKPIPELLQITTVVLNHLKGNALFPDPIPPISQLEDDINALTLAYREALQGGKAAKQQMYLAEKQLRYTVMQFAAYVEMKSKGDEATILSSGFTVADRNRKARPVTTPQNLRLNLTDTPGEIWLRWKPVQHAVAYFVQVTQTPGDESSWKPYETCSKAKSHVKGLKPGESYWFRVNALGAAGESAASDPVMKGVM